MSLITEQKIVVRPTNKKTTEVLAELAPELSRKVPLINIYAYAFEYNKAKAILSMLCKSGHQLVKKDRMLKEVCYEDEAMTNILKPVKPSKQSKKVKKGKENAKPRANDSSHEEEKSHPAPAATEQKLKLVVGLGNIRKQYSNTKHNIGIMCLQSLAKHYNVQFKKALGGQVAEVPEKNLILFWPDTYVNISGQAVKKAMKKYNIDSSQLVVLHDNMESAVGKVKQTSKTGFQGHNGLKSICESLGGSNDFTRMSIGVGRPGSRDQTIVSNFVLSQFGSQDLRVLKEQAFIGIAN